MQHSTRLHSEYGGSAIERIMLCPGSVAKARAAPPDKSTVYRDDGTQAHELLDFALKNGYWSAREASIMADRTGDDEERTDAVQDALDIVQGIMENYEDAVLYVEHKFHFPSTVTKDAYGTADVCIYIPSMRVVYVIDYKHGAGVSVDAYENKQGLYYATGAVLGSGQFDIDTAVIVIPQPRAYHERTRAEEYPTTLERLQAFVGEVDAAIIASRDPNAPLVAGVKQCRFCPARLTCEAREGMALSVMGNAIRSVKDITQESLPLPETMTPEKLSFILQSKSFVMQWYTDCYNYAFEQAMTGAHIPDHKLVEAQARRKWDGNPVEIAAQLMSLAGLEPDEAGWDTVFPRKLMNMTDADALVTKAFKDRVGRGKKKQAAEDANVALANLTIKDTSGKLVLVDATDKRPAADRGTMISASVVDVPQT